MAEKRAEQWGGSWNEDEATEKDCIVGWENLVLALDFAFLQQTFVC